MASIPAAIQRLILYCLMGSLLTGCAFPVTPAEKSSPVATATAQPTAASASASPITALPALQAAPTATPAAIPDPAGYFQLGTPQPSQLAHLEAWTPDQAQALLHEMYREYERLLADAAALPADLRRAETLLLQTLQMALFFFPEAPQADGWRWQQAFALARHSSASASAPPLYASLIEAGLRSAALQSAEVVDWLAQMEPRLAISLTLLTPAPGQESSSLLTITLPGTLPGTPAYFWLVQPVQQPLQVFSLATGHEFQVAPGIEAVLEWHDLTGDGQPEAWFVHLDHNRRWTMASLIIYDLAVDAAGLPDPRRLVFQPKLPAVPMAPIPMASMQAVAWQVLETDAAPGLQVLLRLDGGDALCEYHPALTYLWDGEVFRLSAFEDLSLEKIMAAGLSDPQARLCMDLAVDWLRDRAQAGDLLAQQSVQPLLEAFPYGADAILYVGLYPADEADRARFELALSLAVQGDVTGARHWLSAVSERPSTPDSTWIEPARAFLEAYGQAGDLRAACLASQACYAPSRLSLGQLVDLMLPSDLQNPAAFLRLAGVPLTLDGAQDLDGDGVVEYRWFENSGQGGYLFWVAAQQSGGLALANLKSPAGQGEATFAPLEPLQQAAVWEVSVGQEALRFTIRSSQAGQPVLRSLEQHRRSILQALLQSLFGGTAPGEVLQAAAALQQTPYFNCTQSTPLCQPEEMLVVLLALAHELDGDLQGAAGYYQELGQNFPDSSFAWWVQKRLPSPR